MADEEEPRHGAFRAVRRGVRLVLCLVVLVLFNALMRAASVLYRARLRTGAAVIAGKVRRGAVTSNCELMRTACSLIVSPIVCISFAYPVVCAFSVPVPS